jgi:hypothetical protein
MAGLDLRYDPQRQPPYTTPAASNVWPFSSVGAKQTGCQPAWPAQDRLVGRCRSGRWQSSGAAPDHDGLCRQQPDRRPAGQDDERGACIASRTRSSPGQPTRPPAASLFTPRRRCKRPTATSSCTSRTTTTILRSAPRPASPRFITRLPTRSPPGRRQSPMALLPYRLPGHLPVAGSARCYPVARTTPYGIFASRQGDPLDWDYSETDVGSQPGPWRWRRLARSARRSRP